MHRSTKERRDKAKNAIIKIIEEYFNNSHCFRIDKKKFVQEVIKRLQEVYSIEESPAPAVDLSPADIFRRIKEDGSFNNKRAVLEAAKQRIKLEAVAASPLIKNDVQASTAEPEPSKKKRTPETRLDFLILSAVRKIRTKEIKSGQRFNFYSVSELFRRSPALEAFSVSFINRRIKELADIGKIEESGGAVRYPAYITK